MQQTRAAPASRHIRPRTPVPQPRSATATPSRTVRTMAAWYASRRTESDTYQGARRSKRSWHRSGSETAKATEAGRRRRPASDDGFLRRYAISVQSYQPVRPGKAALQQLRLRDAHDAAYLLRRPGRMQSPSGVWHAPGPRLLPRNRTRRALPRRAPRSTARATAASSFRDGLPATATSTSLPMDGAPPHQSGRGLRPLALRAPPAAARIPLRAGRRLRKPTAPMRVRACAGHTRGARSASYARRSLFIPEFHQAVLHHLAQERFHIAAKHLGRDVKFGDKLVVVHPPL